MLAIQNQISVLGKILETKIQHQQIIEYQQAVSASLHKVSAPPPPSRSRKTSSNQDASSQSSSSKDRKIAGGNISGNVTTEKINEAGTTSTTGEINVQVEEILNDTAPETGCVVS